MKSPNFIRSSREPDIAGAAQLLGTAVEARR
jgi:hypothetical protein